MDRSNEGNGLWRTARHGREILTALVRLEAEINNLG